VSVKQFVSREQMQQMCLDQLPQIAELLVRGRPEQGGEIWRALSTREGGLGDSLFIRVRGRDAGCWQHAGEGHRDPIGFIAFVACNGDNRKAMLWLRQHLGLDGGAPTVAIKPPAEVAAEAARRAAESEAERAARIAKAVKLWQAAGPIEGTPAEAYLAGRGIDLSLLRRMPGALRFLPNLYHKSTDARHPAMLSAIVGANGRAPQGSHITWLMAKSSRWVKLEYPGDPGFRAKKVYGSHAGGVIPLARGADDKPLARAAAGSLINLTEGVEDGLSVACALPDQRVAAVVALGNLGAVADALPKAIDTVVWWAQNDADPKVQALTGKMLDRVLAAGKNLAIAAVPGHVKDVNDLLREGT
jgi:hypothetical protein